LNPFLSKDAPPKIDSGYVIGSNAMVPRDKRKFDIVVLGATAFTGGLSCRHLAKTYGINKEVKWAIAGRSQTKLDKFKQDLADELGMKELLSVETIIVDTSIPATLTKLVEQTRVVATTAGPYTLYGNSVVEFCAKFGSHYVDITGEVDWVQAMVSQWQETAQESGAKMISFCGHDSIPWDLSVMKLQDVLREESNDDLTSVTFWNESRGMAPGGTLATAFVYLEGKAIKAPRAEFDPFLRLPDGSKSSYKDTVDNPKFIEKSTSPWETPSTPRYTVPFVMAMVNSKVCRWSHALRDIGSTSLVYREAAVHPDFKTAFVNYVVFYMFGSMLFNPLTASLMKRYGMIPLPGEGPSMKAMEEKHFLCISGEGIGDGANGNRAESIFYLPKDAGCLETARMLVESGLCLALEEDKLPSKEAGGFWTPSSGLGDVLMDRLVKTGTDFQVRAVPKDEIRSKL
jgi:short subunit dehydrogenase-like uncharacterized protein